MRLTTYSNACDFLAIVKDTLMRHEARNNLMLGIASRLEKGISYGEETPYFLTVDDKDRLLASALCTPPKALILHCEEGELNALAKMVSYLATADPDLSGVNGEASVAGAFTRLWTKEIKAQSEVDKRLRIYCVRKTDLPFEVPGKMRYATKEDLELLTGWTAGFLSVADPGSNPARAVERFMNSGTLVVWDNNGPVSMAGSSRSSENGATVSMVYTPPEKRGHGYASACTAALSQLLLNRGYKFCTLYTDMNNPTSNKIYQQIGYRPVCDALYYKFKKV